MTQGKPIYIQSQTLDNVQKLQQEHFCLLLVPCREIINMCVEYSRAHRDDFELWLSELADKLTEV